jgi:hypothetical protein
LIVSALAVIGPKSAAMLAAANSNAAGFLRMTMSDPSISRGQ